MQAEDRARRSPGSRSQIQERERVLLAEGQEGGHELPLRRPLSLVFRCFRYPGLDDLLGLPDGCVGVRRLLHEQRLLSR